MGEKIKVGIGFATGRKNFRKVLKAYIYNWKECKLTTEDNISINLFVAYDLDYSNTHSTDYTNLNQDLVDLIDESYFIGDKTMHNEISGFIDNGFLTEKEALMIFGSGYAAKRNAILFMAIKNKMDYLLFLDDDEYPVAVTESRNTALWSGQHVLKTHLENISNVDITNGYHCGYISPIPHINFNEALTENDFHSFIEAISNDVLNWETVQKTMQKGGVTYADKTVLMEYKAVEVKEENRCKFITGANLCLNLRNIQRIYPFYNPPGARGEDTFLSTLLADRTVLRVPCYAFHDGFSAYQHLLDGVLPTQLESISTQSKEIVNRFYNTCVGWIRYKPLLLMITDPEGYEENITQMKAVLAETVPKLCQYFDRQDFMKLSKELERYSKNAKKHYQQFLETQRIWDKILTTFSINL